MTFNQIPSDIRVPFVFVEFDDSQAIQGSSKMPHEVLVIAQKTSGTQPALEPFVATNADQVRAKAGPGSIAHMIARKLFANNRTTRTTFVLQDDEAGTASAHTITVTGTATAAGTIVLYVSGYRLQVPVSSGDTNDEIAAAIKAKLDVEADELPFTAAVATNVVTLTAKNVTTLGDQIDLRDSYYQGEELPAGVTLAYLNSVNGTTDPDITDVWAVLGDRHYTEWVVGSNDAANITAVKAEMESRADALRMQGAISFIGKHDTHANLLTFGAGINSGRISQCGAFNCPNAPWEWAAAVAGQYTESVRNDPGQQVTTLPLNGILAPAPVDRFDITEKDLLLHSGISTYSVDNGGVVRLQGQITTYLTNSLGAPSEALLYAETPMLLEYLRYDFRVSMQKYSRHKMADDGTKFAPGQKVLTPKVGEAEAVNIARRWEQDGLIENVDQFKDEVRAERASGDTERMDFFLPPDLINNARKIGAQIAFLL